MSIINLPKPSARYDPFYEARRNAEIEKNLRAANQDPLFGLSIKGFMIDHTIASGDWNVQQTITHPWIFAASWAMLMPLDTEALNYWVSSITNGSLTIDVIGTPTISNDVDMRILVVNANEE